MGVSVLSQVTLTYRNYERTGMNSCFPEMVVLPSGVFTMGSDETELGHLPVEAPKHTVVISESFAIAKHAVTVDQFADFVLNSGHQIHQSCQIWHEGAWVERSGPVMNPGFEQEGDHPAVCVSWASAQAYAAWMSTISGKAYRLPTEAEWEYAARAGTKTRYWWGDSADLQKANYNCSAAPPREGTVSVNCFEPNPWGLYQMHGNVWEWVADYWKPSYVDASRDGTAHATLDSSAKRVLRGGSWRNGPNGIRSARRHAARTDFRRGDVGFRMARTLRATGSSRL